MGLLGWVLGGVTALAAGAIALLAVCRSRRHPAASGLREPQQMDPSLWSSGEELWDVDFTRGRMTRYGNIPGLDREEIGSANELAVFRTVVHPDDWAAVTAALERVASGREPVAEATYRVRLKSGAWAWLHSRGRAGARDAEGRVTHIVGSSRDVTTIKANEERLSFALRAAGEELWEVDRPRDEIRRENPLAAVDYGSGDYRMTRAEFAALLHPEDVSHVTQTFFAALSGRAPEFSGVYRMRGKAGRYVWVHSQGRAVDPDASGRPRRMIGTSRDISALKVNEERLRLALWGSRTELWDIDMLTGALVRENRFSHLDLGSDALPFPELLRFAHEDDQADLRDALITHAKGASDAFEVQYRVRDILGEWRWLLARGRVTDRAPDGLALRMVGTLHDIDALKRVEEELRGLNEELEGRVVRRTRDLSQANSELTAALAELREAQRQLVESEKMAALGSLVAGVAHEINTPLGVAVTAASHLADLYAETPLGQVPGADTVRACVDLIQRNLTRADNLVKSFKQVAVDQSSEAPRRIDLAAYLAEVIASLQPRLKRTAHQVRIDCPAGIELTTYAGAIYQIVMNLVINSLVHGFEGVETGLIRIQASTEGPDVTLVYSDNGRGMTENVRNRVFEPFFTTRRGSGGTGLGMHIVYNLATQALSGRIRCESAAGQGVRFEIRFPISATLTRAPSSTPRV